MRKCDIVMVTYNQLEYTKRCIQSIVDHTDIPSRLIIVDNASAADTREYLNSLRPAKFVDIKIIFNEANIGAVKARNIGMREFDAENLCLIDNDIEVTTGWLSKMISLAEKKRDIGAINPSSNNFGQAPPPGTGLNEYAKSLEAFNGQYLEIGAAISFCMLIKGEVVKKVGLLDEAFETMFYEDTDYSMRINKEGYRCVIQKDVYVWHHGHKTSGKLRRGRELFKKNREIFYKKWGRPLRIMWCMADREKEEAVRANCVALAREGDFVYLFIRRHIGPINHANVHIELYGRNFKWRCLWRVITKRKKPFDLVVADDAVASLLKGFKLFYKAKVFCAAGFDEILKTARGLKFKDG